MRIRMTDAFVTMRYDDRTEEDGMAIWKGTYDRPIGIVGPFHLAGTLETADCSGDTGTRLDFDINDPTPGIHTVSAVVKDDETMTKRTFVPAEPISPVATAEEPSFFSKPITYILKHLFGVVSEETKETENVTPTPAEPVYASLEEPDLTVAEARRLCKKPPEPVVAGEDIRNGLVGYWNFDEGGNTIAADASGFGNNGTLTGNPMWTEGKIGRALSFDGADDVVDVGNNPSLAVTGDLTLSAWVNPRNLVAGAANNIIISGRRGETNEPFDMTLSTNAIQLVQYSVGLPRRAPFVTNANYREVNNLGLTGFEGIAGYVDIPLNKWLFVTITRQMKTSFSDDSVGLLSLYKDGIRVSDSTIFGTPNSTGWSGVLLGKGFYGGPKYFNGLIDDVRIYGRALSDEEVARLYRWGQ